MKEVLNVGIVGLGKMGLLHMGILNALENVNVKSIVDKDNFIAGHIKKSLPHLNVYTDHHKMLETENLDLVYITTPIASHFRIAESCIENETSFFIEKPLTRNLEESKVLCSKLKNSKISHGVGYNRRFIDTFEKTKKLLDLSVLGEINEVKASMYVANVFSKSSGWRSKKNVSGGGVLLDFGSHLVDLLLWYFGPIKNVQGNIESPYSIEVEDEAHMEIEFENKIKGVLDTSWSKRGYRLPEINIEIIGSNGKLITSEDFIKIDLKKPVKFFEKTKDVIYKQELSSGVKIDLGGPEYTKENIHMIDSTLNKKQTRINVFEASKTQSVIEAMYESVGNNIKKVNYVV